MSSRSLPRPALSPADPTAASGSPGGESSPLGPSAEGATSGTITPWPPQARDRRPTSPVPPSAEGGSSARLSARRPSAAIVSAKSR
eukprot:2462770-Alexandrium_andersonii.AAC.1